MIIGRQSLHAEDIGDVAMTSRTFAYASAIECEVLVCIRSDRRAVDALFIHQLSWGHVLCGVCAIAVENSLIQWRVSFADVIHPDVPIR
jgi:hypothetical protein